MTHYTPHPQDILNGWRPSAAPLQQTDFLINDTLAQTLDTTPIPVTLLNDPYQLPHPQHEELFAPITRYITGNSFWYNGRRLRIHQFPTHTYHTCIVQYGTYLQQHLTNESAHTRISAPEGTINIRDYWTEPHPTDPNTKIVLPLPESRLLNSVGMSIILIADDNTLLLGHHSPDALVAPNVVDVTSSGGVSTPLDLNGDPRLPATLQEILAYTGRKELNEEIHHPHDVPLNMNVLTTYRQLSRGGKPHIIMIARTQLPSTYFTAGDDVTHITAIPLGNHPLTRVITLLHYLTHPTHLHYRHTASDTVRALDAILSQPAEMNPHATAILHRYLPG